MNSELAREAETPMTEPNMTDREMNIMLAAIRWGINTGRLATSEQIDQKVRSVLVELNEVRNTENA